MSSSGHEDLGAWRPSEPMTHGLQPQELDCQSFVVAPGAIQRRTSAVIQRERPALAEATVCLKSAKGFTAFWPSVGFAAFMVASVYMLGVALKSLPPGTAYTVWTGIGAVGIVTFGISDFGEPADLRCLACIGLILAGS